MIATPTDEGTTMAAQSAKTTGKKDTATVRTSTTSAAATGQPDSATATTATTVTTAVQPTERPTPQRPGPSARSGIRVNVGLVRTAVEFGNSSRAVKAIQYALADRGFDPGQRRGYFDQGTKDAYARYQDSIGERADGVPTEHSLNYLGFDLI